MDERGKGMKFNLVEMREPPTSRFPYTFVGGERGRKKRGFSPPTRMEKVKRGGR